MAQTPGAYQPPPLPPSPPSSGMATGSMILSILGLVGILPFIGSIIGLVLGYMAKNQIRDSHGTIGGEGMAQAGIIVGWVAIGLWGIGLCVFVILPLLGFGGITACSLCPAVAIPFLPLLGNGF